MKTITSRDKDFSQWYTDVIKAADLAENSNVRGMMIIKPNGYSLWEMIKSNLDAIIKSKGVKNAYFPLLIPKSFFTREAKHIDGFSTESAVVTHYRLKRENDEIIVDPEAKLEEELIIRPTSETIIMDSFSKWIQSYRDLPLKINQWANVMRWEMRNRLFLRSSEFLWQEGHNAFASEEEANTDAIDMIHMYNDFLVKFAAINGIVGQKTESEKFAGAEITYTIEPMMQDGKALQICTSHYMGHNFAKSFDIAYTDKNGEIKYVSTTSWGLSTRTIGALILCHSDDNGMVLPPMLASTQVIIMSVGKHSDDVNNKIKEMESIITTAGYRCDIDISDEGIGEKHFKYEKIGIPLRIELGARDIEANKVNVKSRLGSVKAVNVNNIVSYIDNELKSIQDELLARNTKRITDNTVTANNMDQFISAINNKKFVRVLSCNTAECEKLIKNKTKATARCIPEEKVLKVTGNCFCCSLPAQTEIIFAKAY